MKQAKILRFFLVGLPFGVILLGAGSVFWTQFSGGTDAESDKEARKRGQAAEMMRKPVGREDLETYVKVLSEDIGERNLGRYEMLRAAAFWIQSTIGPNNMGYAVERQGFEAEGREVWNVVATLPGEGDNAETVVVGAHYDTAPGSPGANGNGSGVAGMLALANAFSGSENERTLQFVAFVNGAHPQERLPLAGCRVFLEDCRRRAVKVAAVVTLDSIGYFPGNPEQQRQPNSMTGRFPDDGDFVVALGSPLSYPAFRIFTSHFLTEKGSPVAALPWQAGEPKENDRNDWAVLSPFGDADIPAVLVTDTAQFRNPHHHTAADRMGTIDFEKMTVVVQGLEPVIDILANPSRSGQ